MFKEKDKITENNNKINEIEIKLTNCLDKRLDGKIVCFPSYLNLDLIQSCIMLISIGYLTVNEFSIMNDVAILDNPFIYAYGDYLSNRTFKSGRINRISANEYFNMNLMGQMYRPFYKK
jgi:hypothetical protein